MFRTAPVEAESAVPTPVQREVMYTKLCTLWAAVIAVSKAYATVTPKPQGDPAALPAWKNGITALVNSLPGIGQQLLIIFTHLFPQYAGGEYLYIIVRVLPMFAKYYWETFSLAPFYFSLQGPEHVNALGKKTVKNDTARHYTRPDDYDTVTDPNTSIGVNPTTDLKLTQHKLCQAMRRLRLRPLLYPEYFVTHAVCTVLCSACNTRGHTKRNVKCPSNTATQARLNLAVRDANFASTQQFAQPHGFNDTIDM